MTISQIRRRIDALKRRLAAELTIIKLRRIAEAVADDWDPDDPPQPAEVIDRIADAGFRLPTFMNLHHCIEDARRRGDVPYPNTIVLNLLPWAGKDRYYELLRWDLPPQPRSHAFLPF